MSDIPVQEKKKRGRKPKVKLGDVQPKEPKIPKHKQYKVDTLPLRAKKPKISDPDFEQFEKLCGYQCTKEEIADFFRCELEDLEIVCVHHYQKSFEKIYRIFSAPGLCSLRRTQFVLAKNNSQMAIWLGKIYLGQIDPAQNKTDSTVDRLSTILEQIDEETKRVLAQKDELNHSMF